MSELLTAYVIGASGRMGQEHVAAYEACGVEVVEGCGKIYSIATPDQHHERDVMDAMTLPCCDKVEYIFCEKPIATQYVGLAVIKRVLVTKLKSSVHLGQNFPLRHQPIFAKLKDYDFGEIYRIEASYNWGRTHKLFEGWRAEDPNYSLVMGGLIHMVDLVIWLTGLDMEVVSAIGCNKSAPGFPNHDTVTAQCRLSNGGVCNLTVDGGTGVGTHCHQLTISGTKSAVVSLNSEETDKQACIKEFVRRIRAGEPPERDFRATEICLEIERMCHVAV